MDFSSQKRPKTLSFDLCTLKNGHQMKHVWLGNLWAYSWEYKANYWLLYIFYWLQFGFSNDKILIFYLKIKKIKKSKKGVFGTPIKKLQPLGCLEKQGVQAEKVWSQSDTGQRKPIFVWVNSVSKKVVRSGHHWCIQSKWGFWHSSRLMVRSTKPRTKVARES